MGAGHYVAFDVAGSHGQQPGHESMLRTVLTICYVLAIALGLGGASAWLATERLPGLQPLAIGQWTGFPQAGAGRADPYARARAARTSHVPLGTAEGLVLTASRDANGAPLRGNCTYRIEGRVPPSRLWTLRMVGAQGEALETRPALPSALHSRAVLRQPDGSFRIALADSAQPGNWLSLAHDGPVRLVLTLYDTNVAASVGLADLTLPTIDRVDCRS